MNVICSRMDEKIVKKIDKISRETGVTRAEFLRIAAIVLIKYYEVYKTIPRISTRGAAHTARARGSGPRGPGAGAGALTV